MQESEERTAFFLPVQKTRRLGSNATSMQGASRSSGAEQSGAEQSRAPGAEARWQLPLCFPGGLCGSLAAGRAPAREAGRNKSFSQLFSSEFERLQCDLGLWHKFPYLSLS